MITEAERERIVRVLAFALRHKPFQFGVSLDDAGFTDLNELVVGIRFSHYDWATLDRNHVEVVIRSDPDRFEFRDGLVRARYGHSVLLGSASAGEAPPELLLHGTSAESIATVLEIGLKPMNRAFVHLTTNLDSASQVATAKGGGRVLSVRAKHASEAGTTFFQANTHVWLARSIAPAFLSLSND